MNKSVKTSKKSLLKKEEIITKQQIIDYPQETSPKTITGLPTGFTELDCMLSGLQPGHLILIGARPAKGKTALALSIAQHVAYRVNTTTVIINEGETENQIVKRLCLMESGVKDRPFYDRPLSELGWKDLLNEALFNEKLHLIIDSTPQISVQELRCRCKKYKLEYNMGLVIIDYLQLLDEGCETTTTHSLKQLATDLNIPIIVFSQLGRQWISHRLPTLSDPPCNDKYIDDIIFIRCDEYYNKGLLNIENAELIIAKQKNGPTGTVKLKWLQEYIKFVNIKG